jgi:tRNA(Arg) A34 adenosine deaminase TadA
MDHAKLPIIMMVVKKIIFFGLMIFAVYSLYKADKKKRLRDIARTTATTHIDVPPEIEKVTEEQERFMMRALEISKTFKGTNREVPGGSVVVQDGKIIGEGWNNKKLSKDPEAHAEVLSIINACKALNKNDLTGTDIYATVQPCPTCLSIISTAGIRKVYYCIPRSGDSWTEELAKRRIKREVPEVQILTASADIYNEDNSNEGQ